MYRIIFIIIIIRKTTMFVIFLTILVRFISLIGIHEYFFFGRNICGSQTSFICYCIILIRKNVGGSLRSLLNIQCYEYVVRVDGMSRGLGASDDPNHRLIYDSVKGVQGSTYIFNRNLCKWIPMEKRVNKHLVRKWLLHLRFLYF